MKKFLLTLMACFAVVAANAWTVKFTNPENWAQVAVWAWDGDANFTGGTWPGQLMTKDASTGLWTYTGEGTPSMIIFNNNNNGKQTKDLTFVDGATYNMFGVEGAKTYDHVMCYFKNTDNWDQVYIYTWEPATTGGWPGALLTKVEGSSDIYQWVYTDTNEQAPQVPNFLFTAGSDGPKTEDLKNMEIGATYLPNGNIYGSGPANLYLIGGPAGWSETEGMALKAYTEPGVYYIENVVMSDSPSYFAFTSELGSWDTINANRIAPAVKDANFLTDAANAYVVGQDASWQIPAGTYNLYVNFNTKAVAVTYDLTLEQAVNPTPEFAGLYVRGVFNDWGADSQMTQDPSNENIFTWSANTFFGGGFKIADADWSASYNFGVEKVDEDGNGAPVNVYGNKPLVMTLIQGSDSGNILLGNWTAGPIELSFNLSTKELTIVGPNQPQDPSAGVSAVGTELNSEDVIYNLQGVRVTNPTKGIYIVNGKKVVF